MIKKKIKKKKISKKYVLGKSFGEVLEISNLDQIWKWNYKISKRDKIKE